MANESTTVDRWLVHGWINKLPEPLKSICEKDLRGKIFDRFFDNMEDALFFIATELGNDFYFGVRRYIKFGTMPSQSPNSLVHVSTVSRNYKEGFDVAKSAFESQPQPIPMTDKVVCAECNGRGCISCGGFYGSYVGPNSKILRDGDLSKEMQPIMVTLSPDDYEVLCSKAAKWDTIAPKLQCLSDIFTDLKGAKQ